MKSNYRNITLILVIIILLLPIDLYSKVEASGNYKSVEIEEALKAFDDELLFASYGVFKIKFLDQVKASDLFLFAIYNPKAVIKSYVLSGDAADNFMNDVETVKPILREVIGEIIDNKDGKVLNSNEKYMLKNTKNLLKITGYENYEKALGSMLKAYKSIDNVDLILNDYTDNIILLELLKEIFPESSKNSQMIIKLERDYNHQVKAVISEQIAKGLEKGTMKLVDPLGVHGLIKDSLEGKKTIKAIEYVIYSDTLLYESTLAYIRTVDKIKSGSYVYEDVVKYEKAFELCRVLTLKQYEKMRGNYKQNSDEYIYLTGQIENLKYMKYDKPLKAKPYYEWLKTKENGDSSFSMPIVLKIEEVKNTRDNSKSMHYGQEKAIKVETSPLKINTIPRNFNIKWSSEGTARVSWDPVSSAKSYEIQFWSRYWNEWRADYEYNNYLGTKVTSYITSGLNNNSSYEFRVRSVLLDGKSDWAYYIYYK